MGRIKVEDIEKYKSQDGANWFKLENDGDIARVQFMYKTIDELDVFACHKVKSGQYDNYVNCIRDYDDPIDDCPLCKAGFNTHPVIVLAMYDLDSQEVKIWQRGRYFQKKLEGLFNRYPDLSKKVIEIERHGAKGSTETTYELFPSELEPVDLTDVEKPDVSKFVMTKSFDDLNYYLEHESFPQTQNTNETEEQPSRRATRRVSR